MQPVELAVDRRVVVRTEAGRHRGGTVRWRGHAQIVVDLDEPGPDEPRSDAYWLNAVCAIDGEPVSLAGRLCFALAVCELAA